MLVDIPRADLRKQSFFGTSTTILEPSGIGISFAAQLFDPLLSGEKRSNIAASSGGPTPLDFNGAFGAVSSILDAYRGYAILNTASSVWRGTP